MQQLSEAEQIQNELDEYVCLFFNQSPIEVWLFLSFCFVELFPKQFSAIVLKYQGLQHAFTLLIRCLIVFIYWPDTSPRHCRFAAMDVLPPLP